MKENNEVNISWTHTSAPGWTNGVEGICHTIMEKTGIRQWELSVLFCDDSFIQDLNARYRNKNTPTDILSFSMEGDGIPGSRLNGEDPLRMAGDIVISLETLEKNALADAIPRETELRRLLIHGILHLKGMDHTETETSMIDLQEKILSELCKEGN